MRRVAVFIIVALVSFTTMLALAQSYPLTVVDDRGKEIAIDASPQRIVVILPLYAEILCDLDADDRIIGVAESPNNPSQLMGLPKVGSAFSPNVEVIISLEPDLVLGARDWGGERGKLESAGITVLTVGRSDGCITTVPAIFSAIRKLGAAVGEKGEAQALIGEIAEQVVTIESKTLEKRPISAAFLYAGDPPYAAGSGAIESALILRAGGENIFSDLQGFPPVSLEEIISRDPEVIFTDPAHVERLVENPLLGEVAAVKNGAVYGIKASELTSTRVAEALEVMARYLHPEAGL